MGWLLSFLLAAAAADPGDEPAYGPELEGFDYAFPVQLFAFESQRQKLHMSYLDVSPQAPNGRTVVLLHGKNFCAATWEATRPVRSLPSRSFQAVTRPVSRTGWPFFKPSACSSPAPK